MVAKLSKNKTVPFITYVVEVEEKILEVARGIAAHIGEEKCSYYSTANHVLGLTAAQQKQILKEGYSFSKHTLAEQLPVWDAVWRYSRYHESKAQALLWLSAIKDTPDLINCWGTVCTWVDNVDSWDFSDTLSSVFVRMLEQAEHIVYPVLQEWNGSKNPWQRRQSIVSLLYYSSARKVLLTVDKILPLVECLVEDEHKFVQKAVGWTLRECYSVYPRETRKFVRRYATKLSATAFSAASEKWPAELVDEIKAVRKKHRGQRVRR